MLRRCEGGEEFNNLILTLNTRNANIIGGKSTERCIYIDSEVFG